MLGDLWVEEEEERYWGVVNLRMAVGLETVVVEVLKAQEAAVLMRVMEADEGEERVVEVVEVR